MFKGIENWLLNVFAGKIVARLAVLIIAWLASPAVQGVLSQGGVGVTINPDTFSAGMIALAGAAFEYFKKRRMANPESPVIQTDATAPGANIPAVVNLPH
jgi:hypothetical protein